MNGNKKVAKIRGDNWRKNLRIGKDKSRKLRIPLRDLRVNMGFNQGQMAEFLDISTSTYASIEKGSQAVKRGRATKILELLQGKNMRSAFIEKNGKFLALIKK